jgi:hypothetical protein
VCAGAPAPGRFERQEGPVIFVVPAGAERSFESLGPRAARIVAGVSQSLGIEPRAPYRMVLIPANGLRDSDLVRFDRGAPPWAAGFMEPRSRIGAIRLGQAARYPYGTPEAVLAHESAHQLLHDAPGLELPLWFEEGVATWAARDWQFEDVFQLSSRLITHDLPRLDALEPRFHGTPDQVDQAYAAAFAFVSWSAARYGSGFVRDVLTEARVHSFERAWRLATGIPLDRAESEWRRESLFRYRWLPLISGSGLLWLIVMIISFWVWLRRRRRARALEQAWEREDDGEWAEPGEAPPEAGPGEASAPMDDGPAAASEALDDGPAEPPAPSAPPPAPMPGSLVWRRLDLEAGGTDAGAEEPPEGGSRRP